MASQIPAHAESSLQMASTLQPWCDSGLLVNVAAAIGQMAEDTSSLEQVSLPLFGGFLLIKVSKYPFKLG